MQVYLHYIETNITKQYFGLNKQLFRFNSKY